MIWREPASISSGDGCKAMLLYHALRVGITPPGQKDDSVCNFAIPIGELDLNTPK